MTVRLFAAVLIASVASLGASPVWAQASQETSVVVDERIVGPWELVEVEAAGALERYGATVEGLTSVFGADGEATVSMSVVQDGETYARSRDFRFGTVDGQVVSDETVWSAYEMIGADELRMTMPDGLVVRLRRANP